MRVCVSGGQEKSVAEGPQLNRPFRENAKSICWYIQLCSCRYTHMRLFVFFVVQLLILSAFICG